MPKTLLAVDDSATMRKVLEITFAGDEFRVVTVDGAAAALSRLSEEPVAAVVDTALGSDDGYALAKEIRSRSARLAVVLLTSRYNPYDPNRGREAGVDDFIDKPFDTQMLIDKVKKAITAREVARPAPAPAPPLVPPISPAAFTTTASFGSTSRVAGPPPAPAAVAATPAKAGWGTPRTNTLSFEGALPIVPPPAPAARPPQAPAATAPTTPPDAAVPAPRPETPTLNPTANGFNKRLKELGLTPAQAEAVLAMSRELVERVVWEVVPQMAEAMIREEITRLTKED